MGVSRGVSMSCTHCLALRLAHRILQLSVSGGDIAPLVGHNAFLRWDALQRCAFTDPADGVRKFWSEAHVSEDFDCALRFQVSWPCVFPSCCMSAGARKGAFTPYSHAVVLATPLLCFQR